MQVFCDFDGTISSVDTTDHILGALAHPDWLQIEADWLAGRIDAAACMRAQIALIRGQDADLDRHLDSVTVTPGFADFASWCSARSIPLTIVSDGVDYFIHHLLHRHGLVGLPVISNRLAGVAGARRLDQPFRRAGCAGGSGVCKCEALKAERGVSPRCLVFVGDGRTDFCVSSRADVLFAKGELADYAESLNRPHYRFDTFYDVKAQLDGLRAARTAGI
jgi:hypothetical protein